MTEGQCKICEKVKLNIYAHTAKCGECGILLYYPYPKEDTELVTKRGKTWSKEQVFSWYSNSSFLNHINFTNMLRYAMDESYKRKKLNILDYGGGGGQFALICRSHFPESTVYLTDISDDSLLDEWKPFNIQIPFIDFDKDRTEFDAIFLNDVFEHVSNPLFVLRQLSGKLKQNGRILIDTPKQFWLYSITSALSKSIYKKLLKATVSANHLQIWSKIAFELAVKKSGLRIVKYKEISEYTMPAEFYLKNMNLKNPLLMLAGIVFYKNARFLAKNKILAILSPKNL